VICFRYITVNTLHKGGNKYNNNNNNDNNNNNNKERCICCVFEHNEMLKSVTLLGVEDLAIIKLVKWDYRVIRLTLFAHQGEQLLQYLARGSEAWD
jgi:hypothetical protein